MADRLRHDRVAQHSFVRREQSRQVSDAPSTSGQAQPSTSGARASPRVTSPSSSRRKRDSPSNVSLPPSSYRRQDSPVSPSEGELIADAESEDFGGGLVDLSLLPLYLNHTVRHIWDGEVALVGFFIYFFTLILIVDIVNF